MKQDIPVSLKIIAWLYMISGTLDAIGILRALANNHFSINLGIIYIFAGIGLLKLRSGWRTFSLVMLWLGFIIAPLVLISMTSTDTSINFTLLGQSAGFISKSTALIFGVLIYALMIWEYRVLTRADVRELFVRKNTTPVYPKVPDDSEPVELDSFQSSWNPYTGSNWFKPGESFNPRSTKRSDSENI